MSRHGQITVQLWISFMATACVLASQGERFTAQGVVLGPDGEAVGGATVSLYIRTHNNDRLHEQLTTNQDGKYLFVVDADEVGNSMGLIAVRKDGLAWNCRRWHLLDDQVVDINLDRPKALAGVVDNHKGHPVAGAKVSLHSVRSSSVRGYYLSKRLAKESFSTETDGQGRFCLMTLSVDWQVDCLIEASGYATIQSEYLTDGQYNRYIVYRPGGQEFRFTLSPEARVQGTVVCGSNGQPIPGAEVRIARTKSGVVCGFDSVISDRTGKFSFRGIPEGDFWVGPATSCVPNTDWVGRPISVRTQAGETTTDVTLELTRGGVLEVRIVDSLGAPAEDAGVTVFTRGDGRGPAQGRADEQGLCRIPLSTGAYRLFEAGKRGYNSCEPDIYFDIDQGQTIRRELTLKKADRIDGIVVDSAGKPVPDVRVALMPSPTEAVLSDKHGRFTMTWVKRHDEQNRLGGGAYELIAMDLKGGRAGALKKREATEGLRLELKPTVTVTGTVVDSEGRPIERAIIGSWLRGDHWGMSLNPNTRCLTDGSGRFTIGCLLPDRAFEINMQTHGTKKVKKMFRTPAHTETPFDIGRIELVSEADIEN